MDEIKKYSREWFVSHGSKTNQKAAQKVKSYFEGDYLKYWKVNGEDFIGTKEQLQTKYTELLANSDGNIFSTESLIKEYGGVDAIFDLIDADADGKITAEEVADIAAADTAEFADEADADFSAQDLYLIYKNAVAADGGKVEVKGNNAKYTYKDGTVTQIERDEDGHISRKSVSVKLDNNERGKTDYDYDTKIKYDTITDAKGRIRFASVDAQGRINDKTTTTTYNDKNRTKKVEVQTAGKITTTTYNSANRVISKNQKYTFNSDGVIGDTKQQGIGDCWVLAGANALREIPDGAKAIKEAIKKNADGSITVNLKGVDKSYTYTPDQIGAHDYTNYDQEYSDGDIDMILLEMAIKDYRLSLLNSGAERTGNLNKATLEDPLKSGYLEEGLKYLTGKTPSEAFLKADITTLLETKFTDSSKTAMVVNFMEADPSLGDIVTGHAYTVSKVTEDTVYVVNPWDSSEQIEYPKDKFLDNCNCMVSISF